MPSLSSSSKKRTKMTTPTEQELKWAQRIKEAAQEDATIDTNEMSDWEFLQHAIVAKNNSTLALQRMRNLQAFKQRYGILRDGSVDEAARDMATFLQTHRGLYLSLASSNANNDHDDGSNAALSPQVFCSAYENFNAASMKSEEAYKVYMRAAFYVLNASQHSLTALRSGLVLLMDMSGAMRVRSYQTENRARQLYVQAYPVRMEQIVLLNASFTMRMAFNILRPFLSAKMKQLVAVEPNREAYLEAAAWPTQTLPQAWSNGKLSVDEFHQVVMDRLKERYRMQETFHL